MQKLHTITIALSLHFVFMSSAGLGGKQHRSILRKSLKAATAATATTNTQTKGLGN
jgi:hypothetical protein